MDARHKQCFGKTRYPTPDAANAAAKKLVACGLEGYLRAYTCGMCGGFHLTKQPLREAGNVRAEELKK